MHTSASFFLKNLIIFPQGNFPFEVIFYDLTAFDALSSFYEDCEQFLM